MALAMLSYETMLCGAQSTDINLSSHWLPLLHHFSTHPALEIQKYVDYFAAV